VVGNVVSTLAAMPDPAAVVVEGEEVSVASVPTLGTVVGLGGTASINVVVVGVAAVVVAVVVVVIVVVTVTASVVSSEVISVTTEDAVVVDAEVVVDGAVVLVDAAGAGVGAGVGGAPRTTLTHRGFCAYHHLRPLRVCPLTVAV